MDRQSVAVLGSPTKLVDIGDVERRIDALTEEVHGQRHHVDVAGALAVAEQRALDAVRAGHHAELGRRHGAAAVVVWMQAQHDLVAVANVPVEPLDDVAIDVRRVHLDGGWQVQDQLLVDRGLDDVDHRFADLEREVRLGARKAFGRVLVANVRTRQAAFQLAAPARGISRNLDDAWFAEAEDDPTLQLRRRVVEVDDRPWRATQALEGAFDQLATALRQHLDGDVVRDQVVLDEETDEVVVRAATRTGSRPRSP